MTLRSVARTFAAAVVWLRESAAVWGVLVGAIWVLAWQAEQRVSTAFQPLARLETLLADLRARTVGARRPPPEIAIVAIDERTMKEMEPKYGKYPWPRVVWADFFDACVEVYRPQVVALDILFLERDGGEQVERLQRQIGELRAARDELAQRLSADGAAPAVEESLAKIEQRIAALEAECDRLAGDDEFAAALERALAQGIWPAFPIQTIDRGTAIAHREEGREPAGEAWEVLAASAYAVDFRDQMWNRQMEVPVHTEMFAPIPDLLSYAASVGHVVAVQDADGTVRRAASMLLYDPGTYRYRIEFEGEAPDPDGCAEALGRFEDVRAVQWEEPGRVLVVTTRDWKEPAPRRFTQALSPRRVGKVRIEFSGVVRGVSGDLADVRVFGSEWPVRVRVPADSGVRKELDWSLNFGAPMRISGEIRMDGGMEVLADHAEQLDVRVFMPLGLAALVCYDSARATARSQPLPLFGLRANEWNELWIEFGPIFDFGVEPAGDGMRVVALSPGAPAGMAEGDEIVAVDGVSLANRDRPLEEFYNMLVDKARTERRPLSMTLRRDGRERRVEVRAGFRRIPVSPAGMTPLFFYGRTRTIPTYSLVDVVERRLSPEALAGRIVFVGSEATGLFDHYPTPLDRMFPGVEMHATLAGNILEDRFLESIGPDRDRYWGWFAGGTLLACVLMALAVTRLPALAGVIAGAVGIAAYVGIGFWAFRRGVWLHLTVPVGAGMTTYVVCALRRALAEARARRQLRAMFQPFVSREVMDELLARPEHAGVGGELRVATALFSDVAGFTAMSERLEAERVVALMNEYFEEMTQAVIGQGGYLDKYIGDGMMALFGAPVQRPDHPARAVRSALEMLERLDALNARWTSQGYPPISIRVGINTGEMKVGNFGSTTRYAYTAIGDTVNFASRLEAANKEFGTRILIGRRTWEEVRGEFEVRELDVVRVPGKQVPEPIYEVLGLRGALAENRREAVLCFERGLAVYRDRDWEEAERWFAAAREADPADRPAAVFHERCRRFMEAPPPVDWDGVYEVTKK